MRSWVTLLSIKGLHHFFLLVLLDKLELSHLLLLVLADLLDLRINALGLLWAQWVERFVVIVDHSFGTGGFGDLEFVCVAARVCLCWELIAVC